MSIFLAQLLTSRGRLLFVCCCFHFESNLMPSLSAAWPKQFSSSGWICILLWLNFRIHSLLLVGNAIRFFFFFWSCFSLGLSCIRISSGVAPALHSLYFVNNLGHISKTGDILRSRHLKFCLLKVISILLPWSSPNCQCPD